MLVTYSSVIDLHEDKDTYPSFFASLKTFVALVQWRHASSNFYVSVICKVEVGNKPSSDADITFMLMIQCLTYDSLAEDIREVMRVDTLVGLRL